MKQCQCEKCVEKREKREIYQKEQQQRRIDKQQEEAKRREEIKQKREIKNQMQTNKVCKKNIKITEKTPLEPQTIEKVYHHKVKHIVPVVYTEIETHITHHEYVYEEQYITERHDYDCGKIDEPHTQLIEEVQPE